MRKFIAVITAFLLFPACFPPTLTAEVAIYTGNVNWIDPGVAAAQAQICVDRLDAAGIANVWFQSDTEAEALADWVSDMTDNGDVDVLILYGYFPSSIYPALNAMPDGSIAELFIESTDGDAIIYHADWMFYVNADGNNNAAGLQNMMDLVATGIQMGPDNTPMYVTDEGKAISANLSDFSSDRPLWLDQLGGEWVVEASLAQNDSGTRADPVIVRDGPRGRLIPLYMTNFQDDPKGAVAADVIAWLLDVELEPTVVAVSGPSTTVTDTAVKYEIALRDDSGALTVAGAPVPVVVASDSATGAFDTAWTGAFDGSVSSVTIPAGGASATIYYKDSSAGLATLSATSPGLTAGSLQVNVLEDIPATQGEVAIYTGATSWIDAGAAAAQAQICANKLDALGITYTWFKTNTEDLDLADWVAVSTDNGQKDVLILYGYFPTSIYEAPNVALDGSVAELFIESTDGDTIINHADYMFFVSTPNNDVGGLQNMMDIPAVTMWGGGNPMTVTSQGKEIAPSLGDFLTDRPFSVTQLEGDWFVEAALAEGAGGTLADPIVVRDGNRGRLVPVYQTANQDNPKGAVAAEIIAWLYGIERGPAEQIGLSGDLAAFPGQAMQITVEVQDGTGSPSLVGVPTTVTLQTDSGTGAFDTAEDGSFDGSVTSVVVPAGESSADVFYKDSSAGMPTLTAASAGLTAGTLDVTIFERSFAPPGEVAIFTGTVNWIDAAAATEQAQICVDRLDTVGISNVWFTNATDEQALADWVTDKTNNGELDVLILFGYFPPSIYPAENTMPDDSIAEHFIESTDGDAILNHADWMFYVNNLTGQPQNGAAGLQNMMDVPGISMAGDNNAMTVTADGAAIAPSLADFLSDRPLHLDQLAGNWLVEASLAQSADGTLADPVIVRDGDRGRLIPVYMTATQDDPKGAVAAEIIAWLMQTEFVPTGIGISGPSTTVQGTQVKFTVSLQDDAGTPMATPDALTVALGASTATGAFDTSWAGSFDGSVTSVTIPAGEKSTTVYYAETAAELVTLSATAPGLTDGQAQLNVLTNVPAERGEVAIYTGATWWIDKALADEQAQICVDALDAAGIASTWFASVAEDQDLADWVTAVTDNGQQDVLVLYGAFPPSIYPAPNLEPEGSIAESFIESSDGDTIIYHADWMFYHVDAGDNGALGLQSMMDIPTITMGPDDTPVAVTEAGAAVAPSLADFASDRSFHVDELEGNWFVEAALAEDATGTRADPVIVRDGNLGRLVSVYQTNMQNDPKGAVAAEIIIWLMEKLGGGGETKFHRGDADANGDLNITDGIFVLNFLFLGGETPPCMEAANANDDGDVNITDGIYILNFLFLGGPAPAAPGPPSEACGPDVKAPDLGCDSYTNC